MAEARVYIDTSAVLPLYRDEPCTGSAERALARATPAISALTELEVASALARWVRIHELTAARADEIAAQFSDDIRAEVFRRLDIEDPIYWQARQWLAEPRTALRTLDALHLACASVHRLGMLTADRQLADAARRLGIRVRFLR